MSRIVTYRGQSFRVEQEAHVRFLLGLEKRRRKGGSIAHWENLTPLAELPTFAASNRVEDLLPMRLVERVEYPFHGTTSQNIWELLHRATILNEGRLELHFAYSLPASKTWPFERCLMGLGWKQVFV
jgi:hypothetical protein